MSSIHNSLKRSEKAMMSGRSIDIISTSKDLAKVDLDQQVSRFSDKKRPSATQNVSARSDNKHSHHSDNEEEKPSQDDTFRSFEGGRSARKSDSKFNERDFKTQDMKNEDKANDLMIRINQKSAKY